MLFAVQALLQDILYAINAVNRKTVSTVEDVNGLDCTVVMSLPSFKSSVKCLE